jgi:hypothetical protein
MPAATTAKTSSRRRDRAASPAPGSCIPDPGWSTRRWRRRHKLSAGTSARSKTAGDDRGHEPSAGTLGSARPR